MYSTVKQICVEGIGFGDGLGKTSWALLKDKNNPFHINPPPKTSIAYEAVWNSRFE